MTPTGIGGAAGEEGHGAGGVGGTSGKGGAGGAGGSGGSGGAKATWLDDRFWRDLPQLDSEEANVRVRAALPAALAQVPDLVWESCGSGCEVTSLEQFGSKSTPAMGTVVTAAGPRILASFETSPPVVRRFVDLRAGATVAALRIEPDPPNESQVPFLPAHSPFPTGFKLYNAIGLHVTGVEMHGLYDARRGDWEFKLPWGDTPGAYCIRFVLDSEPPSLLFGCGAVSVMATPGSDALTRIEGSENFGAGSGNAGLAAWSEIFGTPQMSRIRTWSPEQGARLAVDSMPGVACGIAVSDTRITGVRSGDPSKVTFCDDYLPEPAFFSAPRDGGTVTVWPIPAQEPFGVSTASTWGDFAVVAGAIDSALPQSQRISVLLVRLSDGAMRRFKPSSGTDFRMGYVGLDDLHLYIGESISNNGEHLHRVVRYELDQFEAIGMPLD